MIALWAEQDVVLADEFRDGNVPPQSGNLRVVQRAIAALPPGVDHVLLRPDSASYTQDLMRWLEDKGHLYATRRCSLPSRRCRSAPSSSRARMRRSCAAGPRSATSDGRDYSDKRGQPARYLATRVMKKQGQLFPDGSRVRYFAVVTNRPDSEGGSGLDLLRWHRSKAGIVELAHDVLTNELAAQALPSQKFGANAAWFRLSAFKRIALPPELHRARPKRLRFLLLNTIGKVVRHARETLLRMSSEGRRRLADAARLALAAGCRVPVPQAVAI